MSNRAGSKILAALLLLAAAALLTFGCSLEGPINRPELRDKSARTKIELPERPDVVFYFCLERLLDRYGNDPTAWPESLEKWKVAKTLARHGISFDQAIFGRNLLGYGVSESPATAEADTLKGRKDAWGTPYDLILASSRGEPGFWDIMAGVAITQGLPAYNPWLAQKAYIFLKADLHSQFGVVFINFNGRSVQFMAREINFMGCPGSADPDFLDKTVPALEAAECIRASVWVGEKDPVPNIYPGSTVKKLTDRVGLTYNPPSRPLEDTGLVVRGRPISRISLKACTHDLGGYLAGMRFYGSSMLQP